MISSIPWDQLQFNVHKNYPAATHQLDKFCLWCAISDGARRSWVMHAIADDFTSCWQQLKQSTEQCIAEKQLSIRYLRVDWLRSAQSVTMAELQQQLQQTKRNYFRYGIAFDDAFNQVYTEQELNANALLYAGHRISHCQLNPHNFKVYQQRRFKHALTNPAELPANHRLWLLNTQGLFLDANKQLFLLYPSGPNAGRRQLPGLAHPLTLSLINQSARYLASQVKDNGSYHYGYFPSFHRPIANYNTLRHASSTYALIEAWQTTQEPALHTAIQRALSRMAKDFILRHVTEDGSQLAFLLDENNEIKLGGNALCLLALCKYKEITATTQHDDLMQQLAAGILYMQSPDSGRFTHVLHSDDLRVKEAFRIIYYDGEACFALLRYYHFTKQSKWLAAVELAFSDFIAREHWKAHDHWLSYSVNELVRYRPEARYFEFGLNNVMGYLDFVIERITTFPTLLELMMAAHELLRNLVQRPELYWLYHSLNLDKFYFAMQQRAEHMLNGFFWPELAMFFRHPDAICGSFFIRHHAFRIRIDDIEHYLSGYIAYHRFLQQEKPRAQIPPPPVAKLANHWTAEQLACATHGKWRGAQPPPEHIDSVAISLHGLKQRSLVMASSAKNPAGFKDTTIQEKAQQIAAILQEPELVSSDLSLPVLEVQDNQQAVLALGSYARSRLQGKVIAVTGSAGKSTMVALLAHCLQSIGSTASTQANANLPLGVAWNLASMPWSLDYAVLELAIGSIRLSSRIARPDVAVITTVAPAHLKYHKDVATIARKKSRLFHEMRPGAVAIINRDIAEWPIFQQAALARQLRVISFGSHPNADVRLLSYQPPELVVAYQDEQFRYQLTTPGKHMAINSLVLLALAKSCALPEAALLDAARHFQAIQGRGQQLQLQLPQGRISVIDDAYNANPASMRALLSMLGEIPRKGRLLLVLGDMLELGAQSVSLHLALLPDIEASQPDKLYCVGEQMSQLQSHLSAIRHCECFPDVATLQPMLLDELQPDDLLVLKASNGVGLSQLVDTLQQLATE
ncbi:MAG: UDP-N-acetylmuramoyl-tripeptide--D-alanyl-D-alanine ligase [Alkalimonas sp.]|nr:UDP-N-acetylmuramoyl-tripeptide--D-alanyl-D-alanine ligase [Alkalimonas sp.]